MLILAMLVSAMTSGCSRTRSLEGHWTGVLNEGTDSLRRFDVDIARFQGRWIAEVTDDRGVTDYPIGIEVSSRSDVLLSLRPGILFRGRVADGRNALNGELVLGELRMPLVMTRVGPAEVSPVRIEFESLPADANRLVVLGPRAMELKRAFNRDRSKVRLVALLSPT